MTGKAKRVRRDPKLKALDALGVAERRAEKLSARRDALAGQLADVQAELELALEEYAYLKQSPHFTRQAPPQGEGEPA